MHDVRPLPSHSDSVSQDEVTVLFIARRYLPSIFGNFSQGYTGPNELHVGVHLFVGQFVEFSLLGSWLVVPTKESSGEVAVVTERTDDIGVQRHQVGWMYLAECSSRGQRDSSFRLCALRIRFFSALWQGLAGKEIPDFGISRTAGEVGRASVREGVRRCNLWLPTSSACPLPRLQNGTPGPGVSAMTIFVRRYAATIGSFPRNAAGTRVGRRRGHIEPVSRRTAALSGWMALGSRVGDNVCWPCGRSHPYK